MNWYKTAKLADKATSPDSYIFTVCQYCKRWATNDNPEKSPERSNWKKDSELNPEEKEEAMQAIIDMNSQRLNFKGGISHTICSYCLPLLEDVGGFPSNSIETNYIIEKSLAMT